MNSLANLRIVGALFAGALEVQGEQEDLEGQAGKEAEGRQGQLIAEEPMVVHRVHRVPSDHVEPLRSSAITEECEAHSEVVRFLATDLPPS